MMIYNVKFTDDFADLDCAWDSYRKACDYFKKEIARCECDEPDYFNNHLTMKAYDGGGYPWREYLLDGEYFASIEPTLFEEKPYREVERG